jgi:hypothetical protein
VTPAVTTIARLGGDPNGFHPTGAMVLAQDGNYYGTTEAGGSRIPAPFSK